MRLQVYFVPPMVYIQMGSVVFSAHARQGLFCFNIASAKAVPASNRSELSLHQYSEPSAPI